MILDVAYNAIIFCDKRALHEHEQVCISNMKCIHEEETHSILFYFKSHIIHPYRVSFMYCLHNRDNKVSHKYSNIDLFK